MTKTRKALWRRKWWTWGSHRATCQQLGFYIFHQTKLFFFPMPAFRSTGLKKVYVGIASPEEFESHEKSTPTWRIFWGPHFLNPYMWELLGSQHERAKPVPFCCWLIVTQVWHCKMRSSKLGRYQKTTCHQISVSIHSCLRGATGSCIYLGYEVLRRQTMLSQLCAKQIENVKSCRHLLQVPK